MELQEEKRKPGRPAKFVAVSSEQPEIEQKAAIAPRKIMAKTVQLGIGLDLLGASLSLNSRSGNELEVTHLGVRAVSKKNGRVVLIPWANIRGVELVPET